MHGVEESDLKRSVQKAGKVCRIIGCVFFAALVLYSISQAILLVAIISGGSGAALSALIVPVGYVLLHCVVVALLLATLVRMFTGAARDCMPFSEKQADRLRFVALLALLLVVLECFYTASMSYSIIPEVGYSIGINDAYPADSINLNVGMLAFSAIMYSLSALFRYAALLQQLSDDTV
ncbi:hypothetical protein VJ918_05835 [Adlercreutzia sp. R21]|uniref:hypothetical protein n=1 Tax=Adlercreutzia wanghongyangiae TaxID=3111451 RepID=UPI002DBE5347|nr:hypothetical protein [Adlercreutzia sp. R21]MEC4184328.1 hypothetical protein [Adlercreutzia sp. R21]